MKIVIINGSPQKNGLTAEILHKMADRLSENGADTEFFNIGDMDISP